MIELAVVLALQCKPVPVPKPRPAYTRAQRLKDSFEAIAKQPTTYKFLYSQ